MVLFVFIYNLCISIDNDTFTVKVALTNFFFYFTGPVASGLTNKYGCRAVTIAGAILAAFGLMLSTLSPNVLFLFFSIGICTGNRIHVLELISFFLIQEIYIKCISDVRENDIMTLSE